MSRPVPLMFVSGPPVYTKVPVEDEESTSIFISEDESPERMEEQVEKKDVEPTILSKIARLQSPIGQRVYRDLTFVLADEELTGNVQKIEGHTLTIEIDDDRFVAVELHDIQNILWRGKSLPEN